MSSLEDQLDKAAKISGGESDPLKSYAEDFEGSGVDFFDLYIEQSLSSRGLKQHTEDKYERVFRQWKGFMKETGRHPAFPTDTHVKGFIEHELNEKDNGARTVKNKLLKLRKAYNYWVEESRLPHPPDYRPIELAKMKVNLEESPGKEVRRLSVEELREVVQSIKGLRSRTIVVLQLKLGLRATEVSNIQLRDIDLGHESLREQYPELGMHSRISDHQEVLYVPSRKERAGNKSHRPRILPLDEEVRRLLLQYLLVRPSVDEPWLFLSKGSYQQLYRQDINDSWDAFKQEYPETDDFRKISSHYGRHRFSTWWRVEQDLQRELVQYMRGDRIGGEAMSDKAVIDQYLHTQYEDIEKKYREKVYKFDI